jgi:DNA-binding beta-propeller fold protein YncE
MTSRLFVSIPVLALAAGITVAIVTARGADQPLSQVGVIPLPGVEGRIDHLTVDISAQRLFVAALGNNSVEVLDLAGGRHGKSIRGLQEPQGIAMLPGLPQIVVANGQGTGVEFRGGDDLHVVKAVTLGEDADNVRADERAKRVYVGYGSGAIAAIDATDGRKIADVPVGGHPESFQLEGGGPRIFVNVPTARHISVIDRTAMTLVATWPVTEAASNYPMALDEANHRLFIGCRKPAVVLVFDTQSGKQTGSVEIAGDTDDVFWDAKRQRLYVTAGEGFIDVLQATGGTLQRTAHIQSAAGARTSLFVPSLNRLYLAVPHRGSQAAEIRVFEVRD